MEIRRAQEGDEEILAAIRRAAILILTKSTMSKQEAEQWATQTSPERFVRAIRDHQVWIAMNQVAIGWVEIEGNRIAALFVSPSFSSRGVGSTLLAHAESVIERSGHRDVRLEASSNALDFYLHRGYQQCGPPDAVGAYPLQKALM